MMAGPRFGGFVSTLETGISAGYDTNIQNNRNGRSDFTYSGNIDLSIRRDRSDANWELNLGTDLLRFDSQNRENSNDFRGELRVFSTEPKFASRIQLDGAINWNRVSEADPILGTRFQRDEFNVDGNLLFSPNRLYSLSLNGGYRWEDPRQQNPGTEGLISDLTSWSSGLTGFYRHSEKIAFTASVTFSDTSGDARFNRFQSGNSTLSYSLGVDGEITPKISGSLSGGVQSRNSDLSRQTETTPFLSASLAWDINSLTSVDLNGSSQFGTTLGDQLSREKSVSLQLNRRLNNRHRVSAGLEWLKSELSFQNQNRTNKVLSASLSTTYNLNDSISVNGRFSWTDQSSNDTFFSFDRQFIEVGINYSY